MRFARPEDFVFRPVSGGFEPTDLARGPWSPDHLHGGAVAGLVAHASEAIPSPVPMRATRITLDLLHPVPMARIAVATRTRREGKRLQLVDVSLLHGEREVVRASVLRIREAEGATAQVASRGDPPAATDRPDLRFAIPEERAAEVPGFIRALDYLRPTDDAGEGPVAVWLRLRCRLVEGIAPTPLVRTALASDFTSGTGSRLDHTRWRYINPDVTAHLERMPIGEWLRVEATVRLTRDGIGVSSAVIGDLHGPVGWGSASMFVEPRHST